VSYRTRRISSSLALLSMAPHAIRSDSLIITNLGGITFTIVN